MVGLTAGVCPQQTRKEAAIRQQQMVFNRYEFFRLSGAKINFYANPDGGENFCFSVSFFRSNFATPLKEITQKQDRDYGRQKNYKLSKGKS
jgi:hypothetical protein